MSREQIGTNVSLALDSVTIWLSRCQIKEWWIKTQTVTRKRERSFRDAESNVDFQRTIRSTFFATHEDQYLVSHAPSLQFGFAKGRGTLLKGTMSGR